MQSAQDRSAKNVSGPLHDARYRRILLHGYGTAEIMRRSGKSKPVVWRWQARFMAEGIEGLTRDKTRKPAPTGTVQRVVDLALGPPPGEATEAVIKNEDL
jgi:hypothetical protein